MRIVRHPREHRRNARPRATAQTGRNKHEIGTIHGLAQFRLILSCRMLGQLHVTTRTAATRERGAELHRHDALIDLCNLLQLPRIGIYGNELKIQLVILCQAHQDAVATATDAEHLDFYLGPADQLTFLCHLCSPSTHCCGIVCSTRDVPPSLPVSQRGRKSGAATLCSSTAFPG